ncbi:phosphoprotein phosphatase [Anopheles sinensis]|uniref:Phosphoprotein phosphatase n=1 Tax=Anopheles sinensis TaxID=74873 RepID=A0A084VH81_ANOSI|nr:phosphoprotein phosphatase [Anopheles sinensis]
MKYFALLLLLAIFSGTLLLSGVSSAHVPVPYFDQRLHIGPLSRSEMAYLKRLVEDDDGEMREITTTQRPSVADEDSDSWDNSCVSEAVNEGGFSQEEPAEHPPAEDE